MTTRRHSSSHGNSMSRFVVLFHQLPAGALRLAHWDLMIEEGGVLATWQLEGWPPQDQSIVERLDDHRLAYLDYEGPVAGNRGRVTRVEFGEARSINKDQCSWRVELIGQSFHDTIELRQTENQYWRLSAGI